jgi:hypothetical protein
MPKYTVEYGVSDPTKSGAGYKATKQIEARSVSEARQIFNEKHKETAKKRVTNNVSSSALGSQNPRVTVRDVYSTNKGKSTAKMTKTQRMAAESNKRIQKQMASIKPKTEAGKKFYGKAGGGGSRSVDGVTEIFPKMLVRPNLKRPGSK